MLYEILKDLDIIGRKYVYTMFHQNVHVSYVFKTFVFIYIYIVLLKVMSIELNTVANVSLNV